MNDTVRLHKLLARMGVASLRASEQMIAQGRVRVNGRLVTAPGSSASPNDEITVDGRPVRSSGSSRYVLLNKPRGVVTTVRDERDRRTVLDLVSASERLFPVGRLDRDSEGLLLLTNDGELAVRLTHPRYGIRKMYEVEVTGSVREERLRRLVEGVALEDGPAQALDAALLRATPAGSVLLVTMGEGRKREVRRMLAALGLRVQRLRRVALGPLVLGGLAAGESRELTAQEVQLLKQAAGLQGDAT